MTKKGNRTFKDFLPLINDLIWAVAVVIALVIFYGFLFSIVGLKNFVPLINGLAWPTVVVIVLIVFRKPLADFLRGIAWRVTKLSITSIFALEMPLPEAPRPELDPSILLTFASGDVAIESTHETLIKLLSKIGGGKALDYLIVDLEDGKRWLTSRLFIFAILLQRMSSLQRIVFLETRGAVEERFLGTASPNEVQLALAQRYSWLEEAYLKARIQVETQLRSHQGKLDLQEASELILAFLLRQGKLDLQEASELILAFLLRQGKLDLQEASELILAFLGQIRRSNDSPPDSDKESAWEFLESVQGGASTPYWEHAKWIDSDCLKRVLGDALQKSDSAWYEDTPDISRVERVQAILRRKGSFVALVDKEKVFKKSLIDRKAFLEQVAERAGTVSD